MHRRSLRLELIATLAVVLVLAVVSLSLASEMLGRRRHLEREERRLAEHARGLTSLVQPLIGSGTTTIRRASIEQALRPSIGNLGVEAIEVLRFVDTRPDLLIELGLGPDLPPPEPARVEGPAGSHFRTDDGWLVVDRPIRTFGSDATPVVLRLVARSSPWIREGDWQEMLLMATGVGFVVLVLGIGLLEIQVLRPLAGLRRAVSAVEAGDLRARVPDEGPAELHAVATAFNRMTEALRARVEEIEAQRQRLVRAEQLATVGRLSAGIAHEVGNPLAAITGYVELLLDPRTEPRLSDEQRELLERSHTQLERIQGIVRQLLDVSRPPRGEVARFDVEQHARALLALLAHDPRCQGATLRVRADEPLEVTTEAALLDQILQNLVLNAVKAASDGDAPVVEIRIAPEGERATSIEVQDNGPGVPTSARDHLFDPFFTTAAAGEGSGLGLAISAGLAERLGATLTCLQAGARPPLTGQTRPGATFRLVVPNRSAEVAGAASSNESLP